MTAFLVPLSPGLRRGCHAHHVQKCTIPRMSVHHLRARTLSWVLPVLPRAGQVVECGVFDYTLLSLGLFAAGVAPFLCGIAMLVPFARATVQNGRARTGRHAALMLGVIEGGMFCEGDIRIPVPASPKLHGASAAALVLADDAMLGNLRVEQVFLPGNDLFLMSADRVRRDRMLEIVSHAYKDVG